MPCVYLFLSEVQRAPRGWVREDHGDSLSQRALRLLILSASGPCRSNSWLVARNPALPLSTSQSSVQFSSVTQLCPTLCNPVNRSTPGLSVHHQLPESTQTHAHRVGDTIQPSHPLSSPSPPAPNPSQHQGLFQWVSFAHEVAKVLGVSASASVLSVNTQDWSPLGWTGWISLQSKGLSRVAQGNAFHIETC